MSKTPQNEENLERMQDPDSAFRLHLRRVNRLISNGGSLSGRERNCAYLNTHYGRFAAISAVSGLDFADDARSPAVVDWDHDGDLDLWCTNRTAPQVRFFRNDTPAGSHSISLRLHGTKSNRDAIGARVQVFVPDDDRPLIKSLHAGEGFLSQSSKWMHFGLGEATKIDHITVSWPGGETESFDGVNIDMRYHLTEGTAVAIPVADPLRPLALKPSQLDSPTLKEHPRVVLSARLPMPPLRYQDFNGSQRLVPLGDGKPVLINLWASWCAPCVEELSQWRKRKDDLRDGGVDVFTISLDGIDDNNDNSVKDARELLERWKLPFSHGIANERLRGQLQQAFQWPFGRRIDMPVPASFLIDSDGRLAVIYRGPVDVERLLQDVKWVQDPFDDVFAASLPFAGQWNTTPFPKRPIRAAVDLMEEGDVLDAAEFVEANRELLWPHPEFGLLATWLGDEFSKTGQLDKAFRFYEDAIKRDPNNLTVMNNLAWQFAANNDERFRRPERAVALAEKANQATKGQNPSVLDTLAAAYAAVGRFDDAVTVARKAEQLARKAGKTKLANDILGRIAVYRMEMPFRDPPSGFRK